MSPGTEFARDFCAGIGPLQLGVVLVSIIFLNNLFGYCCFVMNANWPEKYVTNTTLWLTQLGMLSNFSGQSCMLEGTKRLMLSVKKYILGCSA